MQCWYAHSSSCGIQLRMPRRCVGLGICRRNFAEELSMTWPRQKDLLYLQPWSHCHCFWSVMFIFVVRFFKYLPVFSSYNFNRVWVAAVASNVLYVARRLAESWFVQFLLLRGLAPPLREISGRLLLHLPCRLLKSCHGWRVNSWRFLTREQCFNVAADRKLRLGSTFRVLSLHPFRMRRCLKPVFGCIEPLR